MTDPVKKLSAVLAGLQESKDACFKALRAEVDELVIEQKALRTDVAALAAQLAMVCEDLALGRKSGS